MKTIGATGAGHRNMSRKYLSNIQMLYKPIVEEAIQMSGRLDICIDPDPMPIDYKDDIHENYYSAYRDGMVGSYFSVYLDESKRMKDDCSDFWDVYKQVEHSPRWAVYLKLVRN